MEPAGHPALSGQQLEGSLDERTFNGIGNRDVVGAGTHLSSVPVYADGRIGDDGGRPSCSGPVENGILAS